MLLSFVSEKLLMKVVGFKILKVDSRVNGNSITIWLIRLESRLLKVHLNFFLINFKKFLILRVIFSFCSF